ncbi:interleukin-4 receptor subunit alpha isoform X2 [Brachyhypopomus gauderio]|uniref:interleukin-4 receptor subunit alpha isoform X2 n=1 Tax=Brachyhypopomus gauderio TaxID=698409 RepID=UPI0040431686
MRTILSQLFPVVSIIFIEYYAFSEASLDLNCVNDYDTEMACQITAENPNNCSEYKLNFTLDIQAQPMFTCPFKSIYSRACECKFRVNGFVIGETFKARLSQKGNVMLTTDIKTLESIKPKRPIIISVNMTENGNFLITWDTNYTHTTFQESLSTYLTYSVKGDIDNEITERLEHQTKYEIVGRKLRPNSNYVVWARVITDYNNKSSDYSEPYSFSTPSSLQDILKIIVPVSCFILVFFIFTIYHCYHIIMREWWDKIPVPKIAPSFEKKVPQFPSFRNKFSTVHLETSKLDHTGDKTWNSFSNVDISSQHSQHSLGQDGDLSQVIYAQTGYESVEETGSKCEDQAANLHMPTSNKLHKDLQPNNSGSDMRMGNSSGSSFSNKCYMASTSGGSCFLDQPIRHSSDMEPLIPTDFEYGPCNGCSGPADTILSQLPPSSSDITVILGYQSTSEVLDHGNEPEIDVSVDQAFISSHTDVNQILEMAFCSKNLPSICESIVMPIDNEYQAFQSLDRNTGEHWSADHSTERQQSLLQTTAMPACHSSNYSSQQQTHTPPFKGLCRPVLHISPAIQIDCSYQRV